jgi:hypothetical protein
MAAKLIEDGIGEVEVIREIAALLLKVYCLQDTYS